MTTYGPSGWSLTCETESCGKPATGAWSAWLSPGNEPHLHCAAHDPFGAVVPWGFSRRRLPAPPITFADLKGPTS